MDLNYNPERRQEQRSPQSGTIEILFENPAPVILQAELIETSGHGFRCAHAAPGLAPGVEVRYATRSSKGTARVIWTHVLEGRCVSGFLILFQ
jgi:hypothetical protein